MGPLFPIIRILVSQLFPGEDWIIGSSGKELRFNWFPTIKVIPGIFLTLIPGLTKERPPFGEREEF